MGGNCVMITKQVLKEEIDYVRDEYLEALYQIIRAFKSPVEEAHQTQKAGKPSGFVTDASDWHTFIQDTYGCLSDDPIERGDQGSYERREDIE